MTATLFQEMDVAVFEEKRLAGLEVEEVLQQQILVLKCEEMEESLVHCLLIVMMVIRLLTTDDLIYDKLKLVGHVLEDQLQTQTFVLIFEEMVRNTHHLPHSEMMETQWLEMDEVVHE